MMAQGQLENLQSVCNQIT